jgi:formylglycine-generating enzyme required for sulfatase activity
VFFKIKGTNGNWVHATVISSILTDSSMYVCEIPEDSMGVFIYRSEQGTGNVEFQNVQLILNLSAIDSIQPQSIDLSIFGIEMVYVPEGAYTIGNTGDEVYAFLPTTINTADATVTPSGDSGWNGNPSGGHPSGETPPAHGTWPNGYGAFYCMKYEITQDQWVAFLNKLTPTQAAYRFHDLNSDPKPAYRYAIYYSDSLEQYYTNAPDIPINFISWLDAVAYADWSGLRPMTEMEFEKACRGPLAPVPNEYAWGTDQIHSSIYTVESENEHDETLYNLSCIRGNALFMYTNGQINGPVRSGAIAHSAQNNTRQESGASYWGIMELSGNMLERCIGINHANGREYAGEHGDGNINDAGDTDINSLYQMHTDGSTTRGGRWNRESERLRVSDRITKDNGSISRFHNAGCRLVRTQF